MKLTVKQAKGLLPQHIRMIYGWKDLLEDAALFECATQDINNVDDPNAKAEYVAVYKLIRVERAK